MELAIFLLVLISGISCREHARHLKHSHLKDVHSAKKFNIVAHSKNEDSMMVVLKGKDGTSGQNGTQGDPGLPGPRGPQGQPGLKGAPGVCPKEQCESNELKLLILRLNALEKYVKDKQNQTGTQPQPCVQPTQPVKPGAKICPTTPAPSSPTTPTQGPNTGPPKPPTQGPNTAPPRPPTQGPNTAPPKLPTQGPNTALPQPPKVAAPSPPVSPPVPAPAQAPAPGSTPLAPAPNPVKPQTPPAVVLPATSAQVLWATPAAAPVPMVVPVGVTIQSTVEGPGTYPRGNGQMEIIQGVVSPQVSVQGYPASPGTAFKKSSISSKHTTKHKHGHKKSTHHNAVHHKQRAHKS